MDFKKICIENINLLKEEFILSDLTPKEDIQLMKALKKLERIEKAEDIIRKLPFLKRFVGEKTQLTKEIRDRINKVRESESFENKIEHIPNKKEIKKEIKKHKKEFMRKDSVSVEDKLKEIEAKKQENLKKDLIESSRKKILVTRENIDLSGMQVVRGPDWNYGNQDVDRKTGKRMIGTIVNYAGLSKDENFLVEVVWGDDINTKYKYRVGPYNHDLFLARTKKTASNSTTVPIVAVTEENAKVGMKVVRGPDWQRQWHYQDTDKNGKQMSGVITKIEGLRTKNNWVFVKWENGLEYDYRIGPEKHDLYNIAKLEKSE